MSADTTIAALPAGPRAAARALLADGASVPEVVELAREIHRLREQVAHVTVDADRKVRDAGRRALDCTEHGKVIAELETQLTHFDESARKSESARVVLVTGLHGLREALSGLLQRVIAGGDVPRPIAVLELALKSIDRTMAAHDRRWKP